MNIPHEITLLRRGWEYDGVTDRWFETKDGDPFTIEEACEIEKLAIKEEADGN